MTGGTNAVTGNQAESLATDAKNYINTKVNAFHSALNNSTVLSTTSPTVNNALFVDVSSGTPVLKVRYGGTNYRVST